MQIHLPYEQRVDPRPPSQIAWYRFVVEHLEPVDQIAYAYLVYDVSPSDLERFDR